MPLEPPAGAPLISVIVTSYNYAQYIGTSIGSVLAQDFPSFELVVVDNASTDDTDAIVAGFAHDPRLRYIKNERNIGLTPNHNHALRQTRGTYVLFLSADDMLLPGHLRRCYDYLQANPQTDVFYTNAAFINAAGEPFGIRAMGGQLPVDYDGGRNEFAAQLAEGCYIPYPAMLVRRALYDELGPMDEAFIAADYEITVRWAAAGKRFAYTRTPSCAIRLHGPQASGTTYVASGDDIREYIAILERYVTPENERLMHGHKRATIQHLRWRADYYRQTKGVALPIDIAERVDAMVERLEAIVDRPGFEAYFATGDRPLVSAIVRVGTLPQLLQSLRSLANQNDGIPWEAVVVGEGGPDYGPLLASLPFAGRVRFVRMDERGAAAARNLGYRLTSGPILTYLEPGTVYAPAHLGNLAHAFRDGVPVVRTNARVMLGESHDGTANTIFRETIVAGLVRDHGDDDRDLIAPTVPIDTIAHIRSVVEHVGAFRTDLPYGETWEFWLRLRTVGSVFLPFETVDVRVLRDAVMPDSNAFFSLARGIYQSYVATPNSTLLARRNWYVAQLTPYFERGPAALYDAATATRFLALLAGIAQAPVAA